MDKVKSPKKKCKSKAKKEKKVTIGPRLRLEPTLKPKSLISSEINLHTGLEGNLKPREEELFEIGYQDGSAFKNSCVYIDDSDEDGEISNNVSEGNNSYKDNCIMESEHIDNDKDMKIEKSAESGNHENSGKGRSGSTSFKNPEFDFRSMFKKINQMRSKQRKKILNKVTFNSSRWNNRELMDLAIGLQSKGFSDLKAVAGCIKTKTENDVREFLNQRIHEARKIGKPTRGRPTHTFHTKEPETIKTWPNIRKWRRLAYNEMLGHSRKMDYSKEAIEALCKKFYDEEKETTNPEVINVKLIYKYMMDCMAGHLPPQLPPKESALVLDLLRETRLMPIANDFEQERKFLNDFRGALKFKPFQVKDEFKKRIKKEEKLDEPNTLGIPEALFLNLSRHKKTIQCFNPLVTPIWMVQKEQESIEEYYKESNVYVD